MEGDYDLEIADRKVGGFQSTPSAWRETWDKSDTETVQNISIHSLRMEGDVRRTGTA